MKNIVKNTVIFFLMSLGIIYIPLSCGNIEDLTKDVVLTVNNDLIRIPMSIRFFDINPSSTNGDPSTLIPELSIEISGPDADKLYTPAIEKLKDIGSLKGGLLDIAIKSSQVISQEKPLNFTVKATAKTGNFLPVIRSFTLADTVKSIENIGILNINQPPSGVKIKNATVNVGSSGVVENTLIQGDSAQIEIPKGTKFKTRDGQEVTGNVEVRFIQFSPSNTASLEVFPGGLQPNKVKDIDGSDLGGGFFQSLGFIAIDMQVGGKQVKTFESGAISVSLKLENGLISPEAGEGIKIGDSVPLWSLDDLTGEWKKEAIVTISGTPDKLEVKWSQSHLSYWNLDYFMGKYCTYKTIRFPNNIPSGFYNVEFIDLYTGWVYSGKWDYISPGAYYTVLNIPNRILYLRVREANFFNSCVTQSKVIAKSQSFSLCNTNLTNISLSPNFPTKTVNPLVSLTAQGSCSKAPNIAIGPTASIWYTESACPYNWQYLGTMTNGQFSTQSLKPGVAYNFYAWTGFAPYFVQNQTIPVGSNYNFVLPKMTLPENLCRLVR